MRVLVTGGAGFLGSRIARTLDDRAGTVGDRPGVLDTLHREEAWRLRGVDLTRYAWKSACDTVPADLADVDAVVHCAASTDVPHTASSPEHAIGQSVRGTVALLEAAARCPKPPHVVIVSSHSTYGPVPPEKQPIVEGTPLRPSTLYGAMKVAQEAIGIAYFRSNGVPVTVVRLATLYGEAMRVTLPVAFFMRAILRGEPIKITGDGSQRREQNHVQNAVDGIVRVLAAGPQATAGQIYNIGSWEAPTILTLAGLCGEALGVEPRIEHLPPRFGEEGILSIDSSAITAATGYRPKIPLVEGLKLTAAWMKAREKELGR